MTAMAIDRKKFFDGVRSGPFPGRLSDSQVRGMGEMLDVWERVGYANLWFPAVNLANVYRETGGQMVPVREGFAKSDADARAIVSKAHRDYAKVINGHVYYGRGRIQNTWDYNYQSLTKRFGFDFYNNPDAILDDSRRDAEITVIGHIEGLWSGGKHKLGRYLDTMPTDLAIVLGKKPDGTPTEAAKSAMDALVQSRRGVNVLDHASEIAKVAIQFYADLQAAQTSAILSLPEKPEIVLPKPGEQGSIPPDHLAETFWGRLYDMFTGRT